MKGKNSNRELRYKKPEVFTATNSGDDLSDRLSPTSPYLGSGSLWKISLWDTFTNKSDIIKIYCKNPLKPTMSTEQSLGITALYYIHILRIMLYPPLI